MSGDVYRLISLAGKLLRCGLIKLAFLNLCLTAFPGCMCAVAVLHMDLVGCMRTLVRCLVTSSH